MSSLISVQTLIEYIEALPAPEQTLLFDELFRRNIIKQRQENNTAAVKASIIGEREKPRQENTKQTVKTETLLTGNATCDIRAADRTNFGGGFDSSTYHIIIKNESDRTVSAACWDGPNVKLLARRD